MNVIAVIPTFDNIANNRMVTTIIVTSAVSSLHITVCTSLVCRLQCMLLEEGYSLVDSPDYIKNI